MNVSLRVENDEELRLYIKDLIRGQVKSVAREEVIEIVKEEMLRKSQVTQSEFSAMIREAVLSITKNVLQSKYGHPYFQTEKISSHIEEAVSKYLKGYDLASMVRKATNKKILEQVAEIMNTEEEK